MAANRNNLASITLAVFFLCVTAPPSYAQEIAVRLSAKEAYVGMPVVLQIAIENASDYEQPIVPTIDGCDVRSAGPASQSSQITIINGRRSESRSVIMQYLITPRREGIFSIPSLSINVDGRDRKTEPLQFVATKSENDDLLFVKIEGDREKVFVGQPLDLTLQIWVKPFVDSERNIKLSEANMWQTISQQTSWGSFGERIKDMAVNNQRPAGRAVLRDDGNGKQREYYLFEIEATVYPKRPGRIDAEDVQIVLEYPTALGKSRDPFEGFFRDSSIAGNPFGAGSRLSQLLEDEFFGSSPFGNRLSIAATRPVVAEAAVGSTQVVPVPSEGRPADYRGAVGRYKIVTQATPATVSAGDPITLNIGVIGTGPMELVQAPPLAELPALTADFKVEDQSLAGFVKGETKVFPTTIRPRREGITTIPAIPFSFFDPDTEKFETVMSEPIAITVDKSESLALEAIVGNSRRLESDKKTHATISNALVPDFTNNHSAGVLVSHSPTTSGQWWLFLLLPPCVWLATLLIHNCTTILRILPNFKSARSQCLSAIEQATDRIQIRDALIDYIGRRLGQGNLNASTSAGALRTIGLYPMANQVESLFQTCEHSAVYGNNQQSIMDLQQQALDLVEKLEMSIHAMKKSQVRQAGRGRKELSSSRAMNGSELVRTTQKTTTMLVMAVLLSSTSSVRAFDETGEPSLLFTAANVSVGSVELSESQQQAILKEAEEIYGKATQLAESDSLEASDLFAAAAAKYQLLVDSGIRNSELYLNLGNACMQSNQLGRAIANYERAKQLDPDNRQLAVNLGLAESLVVRDPRASDSANATTIQTVLGVVQSASHLLIDSIGRRSVIWLMAVASVGFWGVLIARAAGFRMVAKKWAILPLLLLVVSLGSVTIVDASTGNTAGGIVVANSLTLRSGDGEQFKELHTVESAQGQRVQVLAQRGPWAQVRTDHAHTGWVESKHLELLDF